MRQIIAQSIAFCILAAWCACSLASQPTPAFPGAEGAGSRAQGGRGGDVLFVTSLEDYVPRKEQAIPGTLRAACMAKGRRTVVFRVSGTISLKAPLVVSEPYLTLAGQTAPGEGICLRQRSLWIRTHDVIVRFIRVRPGIPREDGECDAISIGPDARDVIVDHCSTAWANDEGISTNLRVDRVTVQWCTIAENLGSHGFGSIIGSFGGDISYHHNLYISNISRLPRPAGWGDHAGLLRWDFRNNVIYNWGHTLGYNGNYESNGACECGNLVANAYLAGPDSKATAIFRHRVKSSKLFCQGNVFNGEPADWARMGYDEGIQEADVRVDVPFDVARVTTQSAADAYATVLAGAGAIRPARDAVDRRLVGDVCRRVGSLVADARGLVWPDLKSTTPPLDSDNDGMPDDWETRHGLDPATPDNNGDVDQDGYTNLEEFLNGTSPTQDKSTEIDPAQPCERPAFAGCGQIVFGCYTEDLADFRGFVERAKALGATHVTVTAEDLPLAYWELSPANDPYPAWVITNPGLLKIASPQALARYIPQDHGQQVMAVLEARCRILRELGLKAAFHTFEPQMLPEKVFEDHPDWRGPRVDHPLRSRVPRYAPCMSHCEVLQLYTEAMGNLLRRAPEIEIIQMRTNDSGAGLEWSSRLYAGPSGHADYQALSMETRVLLFFQALRRAAAERGTPLDVHFYNVRDPRNTNIVGALERGMAVGNREGPDGRPFKEEVGALLYYRRPFAPATGIPWPITFLEELQHARAGRPARLFVSLGDRHNRQLYLDIFEQFSKRPAESAEDRDSLLRGVAARLVGSERAADLVQIWKDLQKAEKAIPLVSAGGTLFILGGVQERWLTRPLVQPGVLRPEEKAYYRRFQFQARSEAHADDLMDLQATRIPDVRGGYDNCLRHLAAMREDVGRAIDTAERMGPGLAPQAAEPMALLCPRLQVFRCLVDNAVGAFGYQRILDEAMKEGASPQPVLPESVRVRLGRIAKSEIENTRRLIALLKAESQGRLIDRADQPEQEYQRVLGPNLIEQLEKKISLMLAHP